MTEYSSRAARLGERRLFFVMNSEGRYFVASDSSCDAIECRAIHLNLVETDADNRPLEDAHEISLSIHAETRRELSPPTRSSADQRVVEEFMGDLDDESFAFLRERFDTDKDITQRLLKCRIPREDVLEGTLISYTDIMARRHSLRCGGDECSFLLEHENATYVVEDLYCTNPKCKCDEVFLLFARLQETEKGATLTESFRVLMRLDGSSCVDHTSNCSTTVAREILSILLKNEPKLAYTIRWRYKQMKAIGKRSLEGNRSGGTPPSRSYPNSKPKVGRNEPCPCGSGRKYKRCCGRNGVSP